MATKLICDNCDNETVINCVVHHPVITYGGRKCVWELDVAPYRKNELDKGTLCPGCAHAMVGGGLITYKPIADKSPSMLGDPASLASTLLTHTTPEFIAELRRLLE